MTLLRYAWSSKRKPLRGYFKGIRPIMCALRTALYLFSDLDDFERSEYKLEPTTQTDRS